MPILTLAAALLAQGPQITVNSKSVEGLRPLAFAAAPSGSMFAMTLDDNSVRIMDAATRQTIKTFNGHHLPAHAIAWSEDGEYLATGDESARVFIWDVHTGQRVRTLIGHQRGINKLSFNPGRTMLVSDGDDDVLCIWDVTKGKKIGEIRGDGLNVYGATFSPKSDYLLVGYLAGGARVFRMTPMGPKLVNFLNFTPPSGQPHGALDACYGPTGRYAVTAGNDGEAVLWDTFAYKKVGSMHGHDPDAMLRKAVFSPNGKLVATSASDRTVHIWDANSLKSLSTLENECAVSSPLVFTSDGRYLISVDVSDNLQINAITPPQGAGSVAAKATPKSRKHHG